MAWTTPKTWAVLEQLTAAGMNEQVRDNMNYLKDSFDTLMLFDFVNNTGDVTHTGNTDFTTVISQAVTLSVKSHVALVSSFIGKISASSQVASWKLYRGTTALGGETHTIAGNDVGGLYLGRGALVYLDENVAAGSYTYSLRHKTSDAARTVYTYNPTLFVAVLKA